MASEWYIQHGGKEHGPLTPATLKKLAAEGKITPATNVRLGATGNWVPAGRVQGLFTAQASAPARAAPPPPVKAPAPARTAESSLAAAAQAAAAAPRVAAPPITPPPAPPQASPLARIPIARAAPPSRDASPDSGSMPAKIVGAVALIFGILASSTFWLPIFGGVMGWTGIVVGSLGLVVGIAGLVLSSLHKGSGLYLNVAAASSSLVGLVLTVVLGIQFNLFSSPPAPAPIVAQAKPVPVTPAPSPAPVVKEPEPPPEPKWFDASEAIQLGDIKASLTSMAIEQVRLESADLSRMQKQKPQPMLKIRIAIENTSTNKIVEVPGWVGGGDAMTQGLGQLVGGELGKT